MTKVNSLHIDTTMVDVVSLPGLSAAIEPETARFYKVVSLELPEYPGLLLAAGADIDEQTCARLRFILRREFLVCRVDALTYTELAGKIWPDSDARLFSSHSTDVFKAKVVREVSIENSEGRNGLVMLQDSGQASLSVVEIVDDIFSRAIRLGASDIHIEPGENDVKVRFRLDGVLQNVLTLPQERLKEVVSRIKILAKMDIAEKRRPQDGRILVEGKRKTVDVRVSSMPTAAGEKIVLRLLDKSAQPLDLLSLGMAGNNYDMFRAAIRKPSGMILVTGPTGSGKTTTLYAALKEIHSSEINISTVEDPVEYRMEGINQTQYNPDIQYTFAEAVKTFLRQDPDVIMIGEIRDPETAKYAIQASQTGHLVFSTLHTNDAPGAVVRMLEMGMEPYLVASTLQLVIAQRLVRTTCRKCGDFRPPNKQENEYLKRTGAAVERVYFGKGCKECLNTGFKGRTGVYEIMQVTPELQDLIAMKIPTQKIREKAIEQGMKMLVREAVGLVAEGKTTVEEVESSIG